MDSLGASDNYGPGNRSFLFSYHTHSSHDCKPKVTRNCFWFDGNDAKLGPRSFSHPYWCNSLDIGG